MGQVPTKLTVLVGLAFVLVSCGKPKPSPAPCGLSPSDWCPSPPGDPCGEHKDTSSCMADPRCKGMRYQGESAVACQVDDRGFGSNCPTVGCLSR